MPGKQEPGTSPLQERTNIPLPTSTEFKTVLKEWQKRETDGNKPLPNVMDQNTILFDARHPHQAPPTYPFVSDSNVVPKVMTVTGKDVLDPLPTLTSTPASASSPSPDSLPQIQLLRKAIDLLKAHAEDAGSHIEQLRVMLSNRSTDSATRQSRARERMLEERRELDAHRALWSTTRKVTAILTNDEVTFEAQQLADQSLGLFNTSDRSPFPNDPSRTRNHRRLIPLALANKADCRPERRGEDATLPDSSSTLNHSTRGKSGTAAIYRQSTINLNKDREALEQRIKEVEVTMPDYVGDLLLEFDSQSNAPLLPLSSPEKKAHKPLPSTKTSHAPSSFKPPPPSLELEKEKEKAPSTSLDLPDPPTLGACDHLALRTSISVSNMASATSAGSGRRRSSSSVFSLVSLPDEPPEQQQQPVPTPEKKITAKLKKRFSRLRGRRGCIIDFSLLQVTGAISSFFICSPILSWARYIIIHSIYTITLRIYLLLHVPFVVCSDTPLHCFHGRTLFFISSNALRFPAMPVVSTILNAAYNGAVFSSPSSLPI
ncbi:hypothetical protein NMY22_g13598 [Coprinellus aureogranulatus]|nr:hypothetical protein NMY22_g13598 [Coprinellus aureogranulatus]